MVILTLKRTKDHPRVSRWPWLMSRERIKTEKSKSQAQCSHEFKVDFLTVHGLGIWKNIHKNIIPKHKRESIKSLVTYSKLGEAKQERRGEAGGEGHCRLVSPEQTSKSFTREAWVVDGYWQSQWNCLHWIRLSCCLLSQNNDWYNREVYLAYGLAKENAGNRNGNISLTHWLLVEGHCNL
jgi:ribonuclease I